MHKQDIANFDPRQNLSGIFMLPGLVLVGRWWNTFFLQIGDHAVQPGFPKALKPLCFTKPVYQFGTYCIIETDKQTAKGCFRQVEIAVTTQGPNLRTIVRAVDSGCNIAAAAFLWSKCSVGWVCITWLRLSDLGLQFCDFFVCGVSIIYITIC